MVPDAFADGDGAAVANAEALARAPGQIKLAVGCAKERNVAGQQVILGRPAGVLRRLDDDARTA